jgi:ATP-binding cassette subfamily B (MDR/TAP) protein 1
MFALFYTLIAALVGIDGFLQYTAVGFCGENFTYRMRKMVFSSILNQDMTFFDEPENTVGNLCARLSTDATSLRAVCFKLFKKMTYLMDNLYCRLQEVDFLQ